MQHTRYPITEIGVLNLTQRLIQNGEKELNDKNCEAKLVRGAKINGRFARSCRWHTKSAGRAWFTRRRRILIDDELVLPVHYSAYDWPETRRR